MVHLNFLRTKTNSIGTLKEEGKQPFRKSGKKEMMGQFLQSISNIQQEKKRPGRIF